MIKRNSQNDTIVAVATGSAGGGIGIVRLSGDRVLQLTKQLFPHITVRPRFASLQKLLDNSGQIIDEVIILFFKGPASYTGEDVLEIQAHGGRGVLQRIISRCLEFAEPFAVRLAEPGEFTKRAYLNKKMDALSVEAAADLINAQTESAAKSAAYSLSGAFSQEIDTLTKLLLHLRMLVEATLDFPEEEIDFLQHYQATEQLERITTHVESLLRRAQSGAVLRNGLRAVLVGEPNVGKSSLLNQLAGEEVAIVSDIAGTTRDRIEQTIYVEGIPIHIIDTAGLRDTEDTIERMGIERTKKAINEAHLVLFLQDALDTSSQNAQALASIPTNIPVIHVLNKVDLLIGGEEAVNLASESMSAADIVRISAKTGLGLSALKKLLLSYAGWTVNPEETPFMARERHMKSITETFTHLSNAQQYTELKENIPLDLFAEELRLAHSALMTITGEFTSDDLLGVIFSEFCIGK